MTLTITIESDALMDAIDELEAALDALSFRHGSVLRILARDIERFMDSGGSLVAEDAPELGAGLCVLVASPPVTELLRRARGLGVLRP